MHCQHRRHVPGNFFHVVFSLASGRAACRPEDVLCDLAAAGRGPAGGLAAVRVSLPVQLWRVPTGLCGAALGRHRVQHLTRCSACLGCCRTSLRSGIACAPHPSGLHWPSWQLACGSPPRSAGRMHRGVEPACHAHCWGWAQGLAGSKWVQPQSRRLQQGASLLGGRCMQRCSPDEAQAQGWLHPW